MAQTILTLCDECLEGGTEVPGQTYGVTLAMPGVRATPYEVDACPMHAEPFVSMVKMLGEYGRRTDRKMPLPRVSSAGAVDPGAMLGQVGGAALTVPCPDPDCAYMGPSESAAKSHVNRAHPDTTWGQLRGTVNPGDYPCPEPGCDRHFTTPSGVGRHRLARHGTPGKSKDAQRRAHE